MKIPRFKFHYCFKYIYRFPQCFKYIYRFIYFYALVNILRCYYLRFP
jgi:hypothetical protein